MSKIILKILLRNTPCGFITVPMTLKEATELTEKWRTLSLEPRIGGTLPGEGSWCVDTDEITAMHTMQPEQQMPVGIPPPGKPGIWGSGKN